MNRTHLFTLRDGIPGLACNPGMPWYQYATKVFYGGKSTSCKNHVLGLVWVIRKKKKKIKDLFQWAETWPDAPHTDAHLAIQTFDVSTGEIRTNNIADWLLLTCWGWKESHARTARWKNLATGNRAVDRVLKVPTPLNKIVKAILGFIVVSSITTYRYN